MRKFLAVAAVAALAVAVAVPAMALDFKFGGEYRVRFYDGPNLGFGAPAFTVTPNGYLGSPTANPTAIPSNPRGVQLRVRPRFDVSDDNGNITATLRLEIGDDEWGSGGGAACVTNAPGQCENTAFNGNARVGNGGGSGLGADGVAVEVKWAYVDFAMPFGIPLRVRAGIQPWYLPKGIIVDDDGSGLRLYGTSGIFSYEADWFRASGGPATNPNSGVACTLPTGLVTVASSAANCTAAGGVAGAPFANAGQNASSALYDNNNDYYEAKFDAAFAKWLNAGIYGVWGRNANTGANPNATCPGGGPVGLGGCAVHYSQWYGVTAAGDVDFLKYDFDVVWGRANAVAADGQDAEGYVFDTSVHVPIGPVVWNVALSYANGDKQNGGKHEILPWISPSWNGAGNGVISEMIGSGGVFDAVEYSQDYPGGLATIGTSIEYRPVKALWLRAAYTYARFTHSESNCGYVTSATPGKCYGPIYTAMGANNIPAATYAAAGASQPGGPNTSMGNEINLRADWDLWTGFKVMGELGWLIPSSGKTAGEYVLQFLYNF